MSDAAPAPLVSVTVTNYDYARYLPQAFDSILAQTFADFELLVIDNASTDDSLAVIERYAAADPRVRVIAHARNVGALASLRETCDAARGRYRVQVDADDWILDRGAIERQVAVLEANPGVSFVYSALTMYGPDGRKVHVSHPYPGDVVLKGEDALEGILSFNLSHSGMMLRLDAYRRTGGYPDGLPHVDDMLLGVRLAEVGEVAYLDRELYAMRQHGTNTHLAPQARVLAREILPVIDAAFAGPLPARLADPAGLERRIRRNTLLHLPTQYLFRGSRREAWRQYAQSVRAHPVLTLTHPRTASLVVRTVCGQRGYALAFAALARLRRLARGSAAT